MEQITFPENIQLLIDQITNVNAVAVTDSSLYPHTEMSASSFTITTTDLQTSCCGSMVFLKDPLQLILILMNYMAYMA